MPERQYILRRTSTEEFEYDPDKLLKTFGDEYEKFKAHLIANRKRLFLDPLSEEQLKEAWIAELFETHNGSIFGDNLFSNTASDDYGIELLVRDEFS